MQTAGVLKPPTGSARKSRQTHICWQQKSPTVVGTMQTNPFLQRWSFGSLGSPRGPAAQSAVVVQLDVQRGPALTFVTSGAGSRQAPDEHSGARLMTLMAPGSPVTPAPTA